MPVPCSLPAAKVLDGSPIEVTLAKPVDKDSYVRYTRGTGGRAPVLQGDYTYTLGHLYDPAAAYLGAPVFYAPQAYAAIPNLHFPAAKGLGTRSILRPPSIRGNSPRAIARPSVSSRGRAAAPRRVPVTLALPQLPDPSQKGMENTGFRLCLSQRQSSS